MKKIWTILMVAALAAMLVLPALADEMRARIKSVDVDKNTITVMESKKDYELQLTADSKLLTSNDTPLADGIKSGDLKEGRRVVVNYETKDGKLILTSLKIRK